MQVLSPRAVSGLSATGKSTLPGVAWKEPIGTQARTIELTGTTAAREISMIFGSIGNQLTGNFSGELALTGSFTGTTAHGTLTFGANPTAGKVVGINTNRSYTFVTALTGAAYQVLIGANASASLDNLIAAINKAAGEGTLYGTGTVAHPNGTAAAGAGDTMVFTSNVFHSSGNSIPVYTDVTSASWSASSLTGGITPCSVEGNLATDLSGIALPTFHALQGIEITCHTGTCTVTIGTKIVALGICTGGTLLLAGDSLGSPGALTIVSSSPDTVVTAVILYN